MQNQKHENQKHEFDEYIKEYRQNQDKGLWLSGDTSEFFAEYKIQKMYSWFEEYRDASIKMLDFGCGDGLMTGYAKQYYSQAEIHGVDPSADSIAVAQREYENTDIIFKTMEQQGIGYHDESFDLVFAAGVFHHIPFNEHEHFIKEMVRVTKKNGRIILFELNPFNPLTVYTFRASPIEKNARMVTPWHAKKLLESYGKVTTKYYAFFPAFAKKLRVLEPAMTWLPFGALYATIVQKNK